MSIRNAPIPAVSNRNGLVVMFPEDTPNPFCPRVTCPAPPDVDPPPEPAQFTVDMTGCEEVTIELIRNSTAPVLLTTYPTTIPLETGDQIRLDASTSQDCTFQGWDDGDGTQLSTDNPYTFTVTQTDMTVRAVFEAGEPQAQTTTGLVFKTDGTPYATEASATQAMTARGIEGTPVEVDGGWAIEVTQP